jgi:alanyl-tRNA synthetase
MAQAVEGGADAFFDEKYGETVRTIRVKDYSFELCGGTHCQALGQIGGFVITGERSIGSGNAPDRGVTGAATRALVRERSRPWSGRGPRATVGRGRRPHRALQDELRETKRGSSRAAGPAAEAPRAGRRRAEVRPASVSAPRPCLDSMDASRPPRTSADVLGSGSSRSRSMPTSRSCS